MTTPALYVNTNALLEELTPMLADSEPGIPLETLVGTHLFDEKLDGVRALAAMGPEGFTLRNRNGRDTTLTYPELELHAPSFRDIERAHWILDGEIVARNGAFQDIARRDKKTKPQDIARAMQDVPARFVAFDILYDPEAGDVRHLPYEERRSLLGTIEFDGVVWDKTRASNDPKLYEVIRSMGGEGVIAKRLTSSYQPGRKKDWLKYKSLHSVTCVAVGYEPGQGSRAAIGAVLLAMVDGAGMFDAVTPVGKVGSGFTMPEILAIKEDIDNSRLPLIEVACLGKTRDGKLRQPVYKGRRHDVTVLDASTSQLTSLPTT